MIIIIHVGIVEIMSKLIKKKKMKKREELLETEGCKFIPCLHPSHKSSASKYESDNVPIENFRDINNPDAPLRKECIDCTIYLSELEKD